MMLFTIISFSNFQWRCFAGGEMKCSEKKLFNSIADTIVSRQQKTLMDSQRNHHNVILAICRLA